MEIREIRKFKVITPGRAVIYGGILAIFAAGAVLAAVVPAEPERFGGVPEVVVRGTPVLALVITALIVGTLFTMRLRYARAIRWYTKQGIAVLPGEAEAWIGGRAGQLETEIDKAWRWYAQQHPRHAARIEDFMNGKELAVVVQDEPLRDQRWGLLARDFTSAGKSLVWFPRSTVGVELYLRGYSGRSLEDLFFALVRHAVSHWCLYAMGVVEDGTSHHERMIGDGCPDR